ncbi:MAG: aerotaxis receptor Aer [Gammaproteobacteria bacterium]|nr:MAG: aerotaxis receptor Aer [Gammaproteobacteria bacterium]
MEENDFIVSRTDVKGRISYGNEIFIRFSGFEEEDLIGQPHNIIRHPDMPRAVYRFMWQRLQAKQEFFGIVKNLCKSGAYYWTFASVKPSYQEGELNGYYSIRRKPSAEIVRTMTALYKQMIEEEARHSSSKASMDASFKLLTDLLAKQDISYDEFVYTHA